MFLLTLCSPPLKCLRGRIHPYYSMAKFFGDVIQSKMLFSKVGQIHPRMFHLPVNYCERLASSYQIVKRFRYNKKEEESSDSEDEVESINDVGKDFKVLKLHVNSLRADIILKSALGMARNKVEAAFFQSKIRVNGVVPTKKSSQLKVEDEVDLVRGASKLNTGFLVVSRVKLLSYTEKEDKYIANVQCFRAMTIENYSGGKTFVPGYGMTTPFDIITARKQLPIT